MGLHYKSKQDIKMITIDSNVYNKNGNVDHKFHYILCTVVDTAIPERLPYQTLTLKINF